MGTPRVDMSKHKHETKNEDDMTDDPAPAATNGAAPRDIATAADLIPANLADVVHPVTLEDGRITYVRHITIDELQRFETAWNEDDSVAGSFATRTARIIAATCCDRDGRLLFGADQLDSIRTMYAGDAVAIFKRAMELNKFTQESVAPLKKNSETTTENS